MLMRVVYPDGRHDFVNADILTSLIELKAIAKLKDWMAGQMFRHRNSVEPAKPPIILGLSEKSIAAVSKSAQAF